jgi:hypothetical protein
VIKNDVTFVSSSSDEVRFFSRVIKNDVLPAAVEVADNNIVKIRTRRFFAG